MAPTKFNNMVLCFSGKFEHPDPDIKRWTETHGGTYSRSFTSSVTHLIVTKENWRSRVPEVRAALKTKDVKMLDYDWFDDKLRSKNRVLENKHLWTRIDEDAVKQEEKEQRAAEREKKRAAKEEEKKKKTAKKVDYGAAFLSHINEVAGNQDDSDEGDSSQHAEEFAKGSKAAKQDLMSDNHHVYMDQTGFSYSIILTKASVELNRLERVNITLYESHSIPHSYSCVVKVGSTDSLDLAKADSIEHISYPVAFRKFRENFRQYTQVPWEDRVEAFGPQSTYTPSPTPIACPRVNFKAAAKVHAAKVHAAKARAATSAAKAKGKAKAQEAQPQPPTPEQIREQHEAAFANTNYRYRLPPADQPRGTMNDGSHNNSNKSVYEMFGAKADRGRAAVKQREQDEAQRGMKLFKGQGKKAAQPIVLDDSDSSSEDEDGSDEEAQSSETEDDTMEDVQAISPGKSNDGYAAAAGQGDDVQEAGMKVDTNQGDETQQLQQDQTMVDAV